MEMDNTLTGGRSYKKKMEIRNEKENFGHADGSSNDAFHGSLWKRRRRKENRKKEKIHRLKGSGNGLFLLWGIFNKKILCI